MTLDEAEFFSLLNTYFSTTLKIQILFLRQYVTSSFFKHNFLSILAEFGRFCWCDFGRIDFWRVKRRQMRLSWKFSLLTRYFSTTLLYQFFSTRQYVTSSFFKHNFLSILAEFGRFCLTILAESIFEASNDVRWDCPEKFHY